MSYGIKVNYLKFVSYKYKKTLIKDLKKIYQVLIIGEAKLKPEEFKNTWGEKYHRQLQKVTKAKTTYPTDDALVKMIYLATCDIEKNGLSQ